MSTDALSAEPARAKTLTALITEEWPQVPPESLAGLAGDADALVATLAEHTQHTKAYLRRQVAELEALATEKGIPRSGADVEALIGRLESRAQELALQLEKEVLPQIESKARENPGRTLMTALGLGFILGLLFGGLFRGRS